MTRNLSRLLSPKTIAVIGGGSWCAHVVRNCRALGFDGPVWPVHPSRDELGGESAYRDIASLPFSPDATFVGVNRNAAVDVMRQLEQRGAGGAVVYASGFREAMAETADGGDLQHALLKAAGDTVVIGPNCYGFLNYLDGAGLWPDQHGGIRVKSGVAIVAQSSNMAINLTMQRRGLPLAYVVTVGNQAQTGLAEIGMAVLDDARVTALGLYVEGIGDLCAFEALAAHARGLGKPIVALKAGKSELARTAAVSHTASLAGSDAGSKALLARLGIGQVTGLGALLEALKICHVTGPLASNRIASMSCSGGEASLVADGAIGRPIVFPALNAAQQRDLRAALGPKVSLANPLDYHTYIWNDVAAMTETFSAMMEPSLALGIVVLDFPRSDRCDDSDWDAVITAVVATRRACGVPMAILSSLPETMPEEKASSLIDKGIVPLAGMEDALDAVAVAAWLGVEKPESDPILPPISPASPVLLTEAEGKSALNAFGVAVPRSLRCKNAEEIAAAASDMSFPLVLKTEGVAHKTEAGALALNLKTTAELQDAARAMRGDTWLVEEMVTGGIVELLIGVVLDPAHGYLLTLGAGGTLTEILDDTACQLLPTTRDEIAKSLASLRIAPVLQGYRGATGVDMDAIVDAVLAVQDYVVAHHGQIEEIEINPLICTETGAVAADVLIRIGDRND